MTFPGYHAEMFSFTQFFENVTLLRRKFLLIEIFSSNVVVSGDILSNFCCFMFCLILTQFKKMHFKFKILFVKSS